VFGGPSAFFGESGEGDDEQSFVAPLSLSGVDPNAQAPAQDPQILKEAVETDLEEQLIHMGWRTGTDVESFFEGMGDGEGGEGNQRRLVEDTAQSLTRKGYSPAQIAEGMRLLGFSFLQEFAGANAGDLAPAPSEPARRFDVASLPFVPNVGRTVLDPSVKPFVNLKVLGLPNRAELLAMTTEQMRSVGEKIPVEYGGPYKPRADSKRASVRTALIERLRRIDATF
jgi:hypothetical protein